MNRQFVPLIAAASVLAAPAAAQEAAAPPAPAEAQGSVRPGDDRLSCAELAAESARLQAEVDAMTREIGEASAAQIRSARAAQGVGMASGLASMIPGVGGLLGSVAGMATRAQVNAQQDRMMAMAERMMTEGVARSQRINRVETLRAARCGTGQAAPAAAAQEAAAPQQEPQQEPAP